MRGSSIIIAVIVAVAVALGLGSGEVLAKVHQVPSMSPGPEFGQLQAEALAWLRLTVTSAQFVVGAICGVLAAEAGRFLWRWGRRCFGVAALSLGFVIRHRLLTAGVGAALYYVAVFRPLG